MPLFVSIYDVVWYHLNLNNPYYIIPLTLHKWVTHPMKPLNCLFDSIKLHS